MKRAKWAKKCGIFYYLIENLVEYNWTVKKSLQEHHKTYVYGGYIQKYSKNIKKKSIFYVMLPNHEILKN